MKVWKKGLAALLTAAMTFTPAFSSIGAFAPVAAFAAVEQTISVKKSSATYGDGTFELGAESSVGASLSYEVTSGTDVISVDKTGVVTIKKAGNAVVTITAEATTSGLDEYAKKSEAVNITISKATQKITVDSPGTKTYGDDPFYLNVDGNEGTLSYATKDGNEAVSVGSDGKVTIMKAGRAKITVTAAATDNYESASQNVEFTVAEAEQEITVTTPEGKKVGDEKFTLDAKTNVAGATLSYAVKDGTDDVIDVNKDTGVVEIKKAGTKVITVTASRVADKYKQTTKDVTITVAKGEQSLSVTGGTTQIKNIGDEKFNLIVDGSQGGLSYVSSDTNVATVDSSTGEVTLKGAGTTTITVTAASTDDYEAATLPVTLTVTGSEKKSQTLAVTGATNDVITKTYLDQAFTLSVTGEARGSTLTYESNNEDVVKVDSAGKVTIVGGGETTITIMATATDNYDAAAKDITIKVNQASQTISVTRSLTKSYGGTFSLGAKTSGDGTLTYASGNTEVATVDSEGNVTIVGVGTAKITVTASETQNYKEATAEVTVTTTKGSQTISVDSNIESNGNKVTKTTKDDPFSLGATTSGDGALSYTSSNKDVVTVDDNSGMVTIEGKAGTSIITITAAATDNYNSTVKTVSVVVKSSDKKSQTITAEDVTVAYGDTAAINATSDVTGVSFTYTSATPAIVTVNSEGVVTPVKPGDGKITVKASGTNDYNEAEKTVKITVSKASVELTISSAYNPVGTVGFIEKTKGNDKFKLDVTDPAKRTLAYAESSNKKVVEIDEASGEVTLKGAGAAFITISATSNEYYEESTAFISIKVNESAKEQTITADDITVYMGSDPVEIGATTNAADDGATLTYASSNVDVASVKDGKITAKAEGTAKITIKSAKTDNYSAAADKVITVTVKKADQVITASNKSVKYGAAAFALGAKLKTGDGKLTYKSGNTKVATVNSSGKVTIKGVGTAQITVTAAATDNYEEATKTVKITVKKGTNPLAVKAKTATVKYTALSKKNQTLAVSKVLTVKKNQGKVTYAKKSGNSSITVAKNGKVTVKKGLKKGTYSIKVNVTAAGNTNYNKLTKAVTFKVVVK